MEEKDLKQKVQSTTSEKPRREVFNWKDELKTSATGHETMEQRIERRLDEMNQKKMEQEGGENNSQKNLWANRKIKKFDRDKYREKKCKEWEVKIVQEGLEDEKLGLYIHIPFCDRKCDYCDFVSYSMGVPAQHEFKDALFKEIDMYRSKCEKMVFNSIYIGGGTPSVIYEGFIYELTRKLYSTFHFEGEIEFTIEINPNSITFNKLMEYLRSGVNRISVGVQCLDSKTLSNVGRIQSMNNIENTFAMLQKMGFTNVNADVMIGLPRQSLASVKETIEYLLQKSVKHVSVYSLQVEENTQLFKNIKMGKVKPLGDKACIKMYNTAYELLRNAGFVRYEVSNFAIPGYESKHNFKYWKDVDYLGLGVSSHSFMDGYRFNNTSYLDEYIQKVNNNELPIANKEFIREVDRRTEYIMLSLRLSTGLNLERFRKRFKEDLLKTRATQIQSMIKGGYLYIEEGFLKIKPEHFYISNRIIVELL